MISICTDLERGIKFFLVWYGKKVPAMTVFTNIRELLRVHSDEPRLMAAQLRAMIQQVPFFYLIICVNMAALSWTFYGTAPDYMTLWIPGVAIVLCTLRSAMWLRRSSIVVLPAEPRKLTLSLNVLTGLATTMAVILISWATALMDYGTVAQQTHVAYFIVVTLIAALLTTIQFPVAAIAAMLISGTVFVIKFSFGASHSLIVMAINSVPVMAICVVLSWKYFRTLRELLASGAELARANSELKTLYADLEYHRDNLAMEVQKRTLELEEALQAERKLNAMQNEFVSMVSHEFRTPLTVIDGMARRIQRRGEDMTASEIHERMGRIRSSVSRLSGLVERTLDASRLASGKIQFNAETYNPSELIEEVIIRHKDIGEEFTFNLDTSQLATAMTGDPRLMDHILANLISNAIKYGRQDPVIDVTGFTEDNVTSFVVRDHGVGIPKDELKRVTERFFRASTSAGIQGTGIGLNFVSELVEMHGGSMHIDSELGAWTEVTLKIPVETLGVQPAELPKPDMAAQTEIA